MQGDFITRIKSAYNQFTKTERKVADFVLDNPRRALFMSITDLAEGCGVGDTSVFRFCKTLELNGYQEFKMLLSLSLNEGNDQLDQFAGKNVTLNDTFEQVAQKVLNANVQTLNETYSLLDEKRFSRAIDLLNSADSIYFFGVGGSMLTAMKAMNKFLRIEPKVRCLPDTHMQAMAASVMGGAVFLLRRHQGHHPRGGAGQAGGGRGDLRDQVRQVPPDLLLGCDPVKRRQRGPLPERFHLRGDQPDVPDRPAVHGVLPALF